MQFSENFSSELLALFRMTLVHVENHSSHCVDSEDSKHGRRAYDHVIMHRASRVSRKLWAPGVAIC